MERKKNLGATKIKPETKTPKATPKANRYFLFDGADRIFTVENDGIALEMKADTKTEVSQAVAEMLIKKYPYLQMITE